MAVPRFAEIACSRSVLRPLAVLTLCLVSSCAWSFQEHEPAYAPSHAPRCTTVPGWWLLDLAMAASEVGGAIAADHEGQGKAVVALTLVPVLFHLYSARSGHAWVADCEKARRDHDDARLPEISSRPAPPPETTRRPPPESPEPAQPPPARHGWCFDTGGGDAVCRDTREACQAELEHASAAHGECQERQASRR